MNIESDVERSVRRQMMLRVIPLLFGLYAFFALDRGNIGLASLEMNVSLGLSSSLYGIGASLFTLAYLICQVPATLAMKSLGASRGLAIVACFWGVVSAGTAFVWNAESFLVVRFLLGMAEAGFGTYVIFYIGMIFPRRVRGLALSMTLVAVPVTMVIASPLSGLLLDVNWGPLHGWQWLFLIEGLPAIILGLLALRFIPDTPASTRFLGPAERAWLQADIEAAASPGRTRTSVTSLLGAARSPTIWVLGLTLFGVVLGTNTLLFWMPQIIEQASHAGNLTVGMLNAVPWISFGMGMLVMGRISDRLTNKVAVVSLVLTIAAIGFGLGGVAASMPVAFAGLVLGAFGVGAAMSIFWTLPMQMLEGTGLAAAFATINLIGNSSGIFAHGVIGWLRDRTGSFHITLIVLGSVLIVPTIALIVFERNGRPKTLSKSVHR